MAHLHCGYAYPHVLYVLQYSVFISSLISFASNVILNIKYAKTFPIYKKFFCKSDKDIRLGCSGATSLIFGSSGFNPIIR